MFQSHFWDGDPRMASKVRFIDALLVLMPAVCYLRFSDIALTLRVGRIHGELIQYRLNAPPLESREPIGLASLTVSARPLKSLPLNWAIAWSAPSSISTKAKPLDRPVSRSVMIRTVSTGPDCPNNSFSSV